MSVSAWAHRMRLTASRTAPAASRAAVIIGLVVLFSAAAVDKMFHLSSFYLAVRHYVLVPPSLAPSLTLLVPMLELWIAVGLMVRQWRRYAALSAAALLAVFAMALLANHYAGVLAPCGCMFSLTLSEATMPHVAFNGLVAGLALTLFLESKRAHGPVRAGDDEDGPRH
jgi:hypothetical protein